MSSLRNFELLDVCGTDRRPDGPNARKRIYAGRRALVSSRLESHWLATMIEKIGQEIKAWVSSIVADAEVALGLPTDDAQKSRVGLYLLDLSQGNCARVGKPPPFKINLRYLLTVSSPRPEEAHRLLGELIFAALSKSEKEAPEFEVVVEPLPVEAWAVLGAAPQPSFYLLAPLRRERPQPSIPMVRALAMETSSMRALSGIVIGPGETPVMGARVELLSLGIATRTDQSGRFRFAGAPANRPLKLLVRAKGQTLEVDCSSADAAKGDEPLEIRLQIPED